jgi:ABC-type lipoprotein release transport system permease subunit
MALGASPSMVCRHVVRTAAGIAVAGLALGAVGAYGLMRILQARLVGVGPFDPLIWGGSAVLLLGIVAVASILPARQASLVSLAETLKAT